jgi:succinylarginine dihydrolase
VTLPTPMHEVIFIGLAGPTHHYGGLSSDNVASSKNRGSVSNPKLAALQAIALMRHLLSQGVVVGVLPPHLRPHLPMLGSHTPQDAPIELLEKASSSSAMWTANAATISPAPDTQDGKLHLTTANLYSNLHRRIEADITHRYLSALFAPVPRVRLHAPLMPAELLRDEGAANHMRLCPQHGDAGLEIFVYGGTGAATDPASARQFLDASRAVIMQHNVSEKNALLVRQNPAVIEQGVFHNDVIAVSNGTVLLSHEDAFAEGENALATIRDAYHALHPSAALHLLTIRRDELSVEEAVHTYFFNSQIVTLPDGEMIIIAPGEVRELYDGKAARVMQKLVDDVSNPICRIDYLDVRQSMRNGGGPACLRLRVVMDGAQVAAMRAAHNGLVNDEVLAQLEVLVNTHYPDALTPEELRDPVLHARCHSALSAMEDVLKLKLLG